MEQARLLADHVGIEAHDRTGPPRLPLHHLRSLLYPSAGRAQFAGT
jgi:hypothetical protein